MLKAQSKSEQSLTLYSFGFYAPWADNVQVKNISAYEGPNSYPTADDVVGLGKKINTSVRWECCQRNVHTGDVVPSYQPVSAYKKWL